MWHVLISKMIAKIMIMSISLKNAIYQRWTFQSTKKGHMMIILVIIITNWLCWIAIILGGRGRLYVGWVENFLGPLERDRFFLRCKRGEQNFSYFKFRRRISFLALRGSLIYLMVLTREPGDKRVTEKNCQLSIKQDMSSMICIMKIKKNKNKKAMLRLSWSYILQFWYVLFTGFSG